MGFWPSNSFQIILLLILNHVIAYQFQGRSVESSKARSFLLVDGDNVRGNGDFLWEKETLLQYCSTLSASSDEYIVLFYDHGSKLCAYELVKDRLCLSFSSNTFKVDDGIDKLRL